MSFRPERTADKAGAERRNPFKINIIMLNKRTIIIIIIAVVVIIGFAVALLLVDKSFFAPKSIDNPPVNQEPNQGQEADLPSPQKGLAPSEGTLILSPAEQNIAVVARNFAERYGSFSTDSRFSNLKELKDFSTPKLQSEMEEVITNEAAGQEFYGVSSRAMKVEILDSSENAATVLVSLQREESKAGQDNFVYYQDLKLSLVKSGSPRAESRGEAGESWLVDEVEWE